MPGASWRDYASRWGSWGSALANPAPLSAYVSLPQEVPQPSPDQAAYEMYGEAEFYPNPSSDDAVVQRGKHWHANSHITGMADRAPTRGSRAS